MWVGTEDLFECNSSNRAGVRILFNNNFSLEIVTEFRTGIIGCFIIAEKNQIIKLNTIVNVCAPNEDDPNFLSIRQISDYTGA